MTVVYAGVIICLTFSYLAYRRSKNIPLSFKEEAGRLMVEFNRVAEANIKVMEDKTVELKEVIDLADDRIRRLNTLVANLGALKEGEKRVKRGGRYNRVFSLIDAGWQVGDIAREVEISQGEIQLLIGLTSKKGNCSKLS
ncbi:MAG: hypothetical protein AB1797_04010 [bacterium]